jgi:hypothetical protein
LRVDIFDVAKSTSKKAKEMTFEKKSFQRSGPRVTQQREKSFHDKYYAMDAFGKKCFFGSRMV